MGDLTKIICKDNLKFDWYEILDAFELTEKFDANPSIYEIKLLASLAITSQDPPGICVHPGGRKTLEKVCDLLSQAVSEYYHRNATVSLCDDIHYFLQVEM